MTSSNSGLPSTLRLAESSGSTSAMPMCASLLVFEAIV
jgi:hypothetical protein